MKLHDYLQLPDSRTVSQLRAMGVAKSDAQIRQWQHGYADRRPSPINRVALERATDGKVNVEEWGSDCKWRRIKDRSWPHPDGRPFLAFELAEPAKAEEGA